MADRRRCPCVHLKQGDSFWLKAFASTNWSRHFSTVISMFLGLHFTMVSNLIWDFFMPLVFAPCATICRSSPSEAQNV